MNQNHVKMLRAMEDASGGDWIQDLLEVKPGICVLWEEDSEPEFFNLEDAMAWTKEELRANHGGGLIIPSVEDYLGMCRNKDPHTLSYDIAYFAEAEKVRCMSHETWSEFILAFVQHEVKSLSWDGEGWR